MKFSKKASVATLVLTLWAYQPMAAQAANGTTTGGGGAPAPAPHVEPAHVQPAPAPHVEPAHVAPAPHVEPAHVAPAAHVEPAHAAPTTGGGGFHFGGDTHPNNDTGNFGNHPATGGGDHHPATGGGDHHPATGGGDVHPGGGDHHPATGGGDVHPGGGDHHPGGGGDVHPGGGDAHTGGGDHRPGGGGDRPDNRDFHDRHGHDMGWYNGHGVDGDYHHARHNNRDCHWDDARGGFYYDDDNSVVVVAGAEVDDTSGDSCSSSCGSMHSAISQSCSGTNNKEEDMIDRMGRHGAKYLVSHQIAPELGKALGYFQEDLKARDNTHPALTDHDALTREFLQQIKKHQASR